MPFQPKFADSYTPGDLFYGLAKPRDGLMRHLNVPFDHAAGARINSYDIGDVADQTQGRPSQNEEFKRYLGAHGKYNAVVDLRKYEWRHWRQKSKGGIEWAVSVGKTVHFCLDDMMDPGIQHAITQKCWDNESPKGTPWDQKVRAITNAELRWIYRHRREAAVQRHVQFWFANSPCGPPWESSPTLGDLWKAYKDN